VKGQEMNKFKWQNMKAKIPTETEEGVSSFEFTYMRGENKVGIEIAQCPFCHGEIGIDISYLIQVQTHVQCPMCTLYFSFKESSDGVTENYDLEELVEMAGPKP
jgi:hypothetical protein